VPDGSLVGGSIGPQLLVLILAHVPHSDLLPRAGKHLAVAQPAQLLQLRGAAVSAQRVQVLAASSEQAQEPAGAGAKARRAWDSRQDSVLKTADLGATQLSGVTSAGLMGDCTHRHFLSLS
jgi:hypothetical protein